jgi:ATP-dependent DNA helicase PIF1
LHVKIITGPCAGQQAFIPQITLISSDELPFELRHHQFPVRLAFVMTINKSQGQSLGTVGLDLRDPVFAHGQTESRAEDMNS